MRHEIKKHSAWLAVLVVLLLLTPLASGLPDGLERVAINLSFVDQEQSLWHHAPFTDYSIKLMGDGALSTLGAAMAGIAVLLLCAGIVLKLKNRNRKKEAYK
ncbi:PDGLE domain-containing protein [Fontibacillus sp. BL9]|uniref:PDGLE domain-containing protein n=1 Tax=Fontibacillus sp. BL9 TaxID=3389971 RepID=UPI003978A165